jgi:hypothetical protein
MHKAEPILLNSFNVTLGLAFELWMIPKDDKTGRWKETQESLLKRPLRSLAHKELKKGIDSFVSEAGTEGELTMSDNHFQTS